jgi:hypothetical protein
MCKSSQWECESRREACARPHPLAQRKHGSFIRYRPVIHLFVGLIHLFVSIAEVEDKVFLDQFVSTTSFDSITLRVAVLSVDMV